LSPKELAQPAAAANAEPARPGAPVTKSRWIGIRATHHKAAAAIPAAEIEHTGDGLTVGIQSRIDDAWTISWRGCGPAISSAT